MDRPELGRTEHSMYVTHHIGSHDFEDDVLIPEDIFKKAMKQYLNDNALDIHGTEDAVYNAFDYKHLDAEDNFADNPDFIKICQSLYYGSKWNIEDKDYYKWLYEDEIIEKNESDLSEEIKLRNPYDRRKYVIVPEKIEKAMESPKYKEWYDICLKYYNNRGVEKHYEPREQEFKRHFVFGYYPDEESLKKFFSEFGVKDLSDIRHPEHGYGHSEFEVHTDIEGVDVFVSASTRFRIYTLHAQIDPNKTDLSEEKSKIDTNYSMLKGEEAECLTRIREKLISIIRETGAIRDVYYEVGSANLVPTWDDSDIMDFVDLCLDDMDDKIPEELEEWFDRLYNDPRDIKTRLLEYAGMLQSEDLSEETDLDPEPQVTICSDIEILED